MSAHPAEAPEMEPPSQETVGLGMLSERYRASLSRTQRLAASVGSELPVHTIDLAAGSNIPSEPGAYLFDEQVTVSRGGNILAAMFALEPKTLSGKIDSAHAVLPGKLSFLYSINGKLAEGHRYVAAKGYYKRELEDRFRRMEAEIQISRSQRERGEIAFDPIAVVVAPPEYKGKQTDNSAYELLLVTALDEGVTTLDNQPWQLGFDQANLALAESAVDALGRFNTTIGMHGDAKIKNVAQGPSGQTSMIDFETSRTIDLEDPSSVAAAVNEDLAKLFKSLSDQGFFEREPYRAREVLEALAEKYAGHWQSRSPAVQNAVYEAIINVVDNCVGQVRPPAFQKAMA